MPDEGFKRKLTAILSADVEGYSRLMGEDEDGTIRTLTTYRELMSTLIQKHRGRVVDSPGDNLLAEFLSVVDAVRCAVEIQEELRVRNAELPENRKMEFRIGINLGDVVEEGERIYGDGINIAARVEGLAEGGGICISGTVYDSIKNKLSLSYESLGEHSVKNIKEPVRIYRMRVGPEAAAPVVKEKKAMLRKWQWVALAVVVILILGAVAVWHFYFRPPPIEPASIEKMAFPLPDKPSIAVLPLKNISDDPKQEFFVDGMTDDLITDLSKISGLFVIASNSVFTYKGKPVKIKQVGRELGVRYVLEGSVRRAENQVRINAQLIDTKTGGHLWAERYDDKWENIFTLQDKITHKIVSALAVKLTASEQEQVTRKWTDNTEAYDAFLKGVGHLIRWTTAEDIRKAVFYLKKAIELDPNYGRAYAVLGFAYFWDYQGHLGLPLHKAKVKAREYLKMSMKNPNPSAHSLAAHINYNLNLHKEAVSEAEKALALAPKSSDVHSTMAEVLNWACNPKEAVKFAELEMRYDPSRIGFGLHHLGVAHFCMGKLEQAITYFKRCLTHKPEFDAFTLHFLAAAYSHLGRDMEAQVALKDWTVNKGWNPNLRDVMTVAGKFRDPEVNERLASGLLKAGLPGEPSGYYKIYEENRLTGKELKKLILGSDIGKWWVESDMLCSKWKLFDDSCFPVFRNPDGTPEGKDEYLLINFIGIDPFSSVLDLSKKTKPTTIKKEVKAAPPPMKWTSDADGIGKDGVFTRKNPPSFSFKYPENFVIARLFDELIFKITGTTGLPVVEVGVGKITGDVKKFLDGFAEGYKKYLENSGVGTDITINYNKSLPTVTYGADYLAQEFEIDWKYGGNLPLTTYANVIVKEGYYISMSGIKGKDIGDIDKFKAIFKTIELEP